MCHLTWKKQIYQQNIIGLISQLVGGRQIGYKRSLAEKFTWGVPRNNSNLVVRADCGFHFQRPSRSPTLPPRGRWGLRFSGVTSTGLWHQQATAISTDNIWLQLVTSRPGHVSTFLSPFRLIMICFPSFIEFSYVRQSVVGPYWKLAL